MTALSATSNNLANATTPGFKAQQTRFQEHLIQAQFAGNARQEMRYSGVREVRSDLSPGPLRVTQRALDVAITTDAGFFAVQTPQGERYTRAGAFHMTPTGALVTAEGHSVLGEAGRPVEVGAIEGEVSIAEDGTVRVGDEDMGRLRMVTFQDKTGLLPEGAQLFRASPESGAAQSTQASLHVGAVEMPNVSVVKGMTQLVSVSRTFETLQRAVEVFSELEHQAATEITRAR